jgi:Domain of unknown function (DUF4185)
LLGYCVREERRSQVKVWRSLGRPRTAIVAATILATVAITTVPLAAPASAATSAANLPAAVGLKAYVYSGTGYTFTEGDGSYAQHLLDGRVIWFFSDSFLGTVSPDGSRGSSGMLHNQIVVQDSPTASSASSFHNVWPNGWGTNAFAASGCSAEWPAASIQSALNQVEVVLRCADSGGNVVRLDLATLTINSGLTGWTVSIDTTNFNSAALVPGMSCSPNPSTAQVEFGQSIMQLGGYTYIYGLQACPVSGIPEGHAYVARVSGNDISQPGSWQYWNGASSWVSGPANAAPMLSGGTPIIHAGSEYSVVYDPSRNLYRMISSDTGPSSSVVEYTAAPNPYGPWTYDGIIDNTQADGVYGSKPVDDPSSPCTLTTYGAKEQPTFEVNGDIVFTYNVNVTGCSAADEEAAFQANVANYNPVFMYG